MTIDHDLRTMLRERAADVRPDPNARDRIAERIAHGAPADVAPLTPARHPAWPRLAAAAASLAIVGLAGALLVARGDGTTTVAPAGPPDTAPAGSTPASGGDADDADDRDAPMMPDVPPSVLTSHVVFGEGRGFDSPAALAEAWARSRFPDFPAPGVTLDAPLSPTEAPDQAMVRYRTQTDPEGVLAQGALWTFERDGEWLVQVVTLDDVRIERAEITGRVLRFSGMASTDQPLAISILDGNGEHLGAPEHGGADRIPVTEARFGGSVVLDAPADPTVLRFELLGGTVLGVAEVPIDPVRPAISARVVSGDAGEDELGALAAETVADLLGDGDRPAGGVTATGYAEEPANEADEAVIAVDTADGTYLVHLARVPGEVTGDAPADQADPAIGVVEIRHEALGEPTVTWSEPGSLRGTLTAPAAGVVDIAVQSRPAPGGDLRDEGGREEPVEAGAVVWDLSGDWPDDPLTITVTVLPAEGGRYLWRAAI